MATVKLTSARSAHHRDPSLSSYLGYAEETAVPRSGEPTIHIPSATTIAPCESLGKKRNRYGEIGVFSAERYFNSFLDENAAKPVGKNNEKVGIRDMQQETARINPNAFPKADWRGKNRFLPTIQSRRDKPSGKSFFTKLCCNWYCSGKKSVAVEGKKLDKTCIKHKKDGGVQEKAMTKLPTKIKHDSLGLNKIKRPRTPFVCWSEEEILCNKLKKNEGDGIDSEDCFSLNIPNSSVRNLLLETKIDKVEAADARQSLEVHGSPTMNKEMPSSLEKTLAMLNWDAIPTVETIASFVASEASSDTESDLSSDLFELKALSDGGHPFFRRHPSDSMSGCLSPSSGYEPSEASISWSVTTASVANFSVATGYDETTSIEVLKSNESLMAMDNTANRMNVAKAETSKDTTKRCPSIMLSCKNHKAVKVTQAHKLPEKKPELRDKTSQNLFHQGPDFKPRVE